MGYKPFQVLKVPRLAARKSQQSRTSAVKDTNLKIRCDKTETTQNPSQITHVVIKNAIKIATGNASRGA
jgi:hypothetical protein